MPRRPGPPASSPGAARRASRRRGIPSGAPRLFRSSLRAPVPPRPTAGLRRGISPTGSWRRRSSWELGCSELELDAVPERPADAEEHHPDCPFLLPFLARDVNGAPSVVIELLDEFRAPLRQALQTLVERAALAGLPGSFRLVRLEILPQARGQDGLQGAPLPVASGGQVFEVSQRAVAGDP